MNNGYIKLHRKIINDEIFDNANLLKVWVWCLCKASHKERTVSVGLQSVELAQGQFITGRDSAAAELNMKPTTAWRYLKKLEKCGNLDIKSNNKFSLVRSVNIHLCSGKVLSSVFQAGFSVPLQYQRQQ